MGALRLLADAGVNLTRIESRPVVSRPWEYVFYVDVRFDDASLADQAVNLLQKDCLWLEGARAVSGSLIFALTLFAFRLMDLRPMPMTALDVSASYRGDAMRKAGWDETLVRWRHRMKQET